MKLIKFLLVMVIFGCSISGVQASEGVLESGKKDDISEVASDEDVILLKEAFLSGKLGIQKTRLREIKESYGEPKSVIINTAKKLTYDYNGEIKIEFEKKKIFKEWSYDGFKSPVYTDDVDDLRYDLESKTALIGENIIFSKVRKDYDEPTESYETEEDGDVSVYYYGDIKLVFENDIRVKKWQVRGLQENRVEGVLETK